MLDSLACALVKCLSAILCALPPGVAVRIGEGFGLLAYAVSGKRARIGIRNLRAAFDGVLMPAQGRRIIRGCYRQLGASVVELLRLPAMDRASVDRYLSVEGRDHFDRAVASGKPIILLTGHYGNWELSSIAAALSGYPITALARAQDNLPKLYRLLVSYRESKGCRIIHKGGAMKQLIAALGQHRLVGIVGDQASRQGVFVEFFGRPALFATGPFELARRHDALILPAFIRRLDGPFHRLLIDPPIDTIEQFAAALARRILDDPSQWLWMHKRWKHTPARRALVLSDGKLGHLKQSLAVVEALRERCPTLTHEVVDIRYRHGAARALALGWSWAMPSGWGAARCLQWALTPECARALLSRYADVIVSCGASTAPANVLWSADNGAKSVVLMNPSPLPLRRFHLVIAPEHDGLPPHPNVVKILGAMVAPMPEDALAQAGVLLRAHPQFRGGNESAPRRPVVAVCLGGETAHYTLDAAFADALMEQVQSACRQIDGWCAVTTSRRTGSPVEQRLDDRLRDAPHCRLLLLAGRDALNGTMEGMLGLADVLVVTGESISMVSEACASGRHVIVVEPPRRPSSGHATKHRRFLEALVEAGHIRLVDLPELADAIQRLVTERPPVKCVDTYARVRDAVAKLV